MMYTIFSGFVIITRHIKSKRERRKFIYSKSFVSFCKGISCIIRKEESNDINVFFEFKNLKLG